MKTAFLVQEGLALTAERYPEKTALICGEERWTYREIHDRSTRLAHGLKAMGVGCRDRVLIFLDNSVEFVLSIYGILHAKGVFVPLSSSLKARKLAYIIRDSGASLLITHTSKARVVQEAMAQLDEFPGVLWVGDPAGIPGELAGKCFRWDEALDGNDRQQSMPNLNNSCIDRDLAALIYTSGSTGEPKGVMSPHSAMMSAVRSIIQYLENTADDIVLNVLPLSFDYGLYQVLMAFTFGGTVVLENSFAFPIKILEKIQAERVTGFPLVPTVAAMLLKIQSLEKYDLGSLRYISNTAAALPVERIRRLRDRFPGVRIYSMYGLTECKRVSYLPPEELDRRPASVGKPIPNCQVFLMDDQAKEVPVGQIGELVVRGANVMGGYWNAPDLTAKVFRKGVIRGETLLYSGDLFRRDAEGFLYFVARKDDLIKTRGERVSPTEVEMVLCEVPGILEAAVVGVPDDVLGQAVKACVVRLSGAQVTERDVLKHCVEQLESFMVPKTVEFLDALPRTANGKVDKLRLKGRTDSPQRHKDTNKHKEELVL